MKKLSAITALRCSSLSIICATAIMAGCSSTDTLSTSELLAKTKRTNNDGVSCKMERPIGSQMKSRVCRSAAEREAIAESSQKIFERLQ